MLVIREQQVQHFIAENDQQLVELIAQAIRETNAERTAHLDDAQLAAMVEYGVKRARSHDLRRAENLAAFVGLMFEIAPDFDLQPQIKTVLADANHPADERLFQLWQRTSDTDWREAENLYKAETWFPDPKQ